MRIDRSKQSRGGHGASRRCALTLAVLVGGGSLLAACSSTSSADANAKASSGSNRAPIPASAFSSTVGLTSSTVRIGNVSTETGGLFTGSVVGTEAYADYVNSTGGVNGRQLIVDVHNDGFTGAGNKQGTESAVGSDFALVGSFSLEDSFGGTVMAQNPGVPDASTTLDPTLNQLPNAFSANPAGQGWPTGPLDYFKKMYSTWIHRPTTWQGSESGDRHGEGSAGFGRTSSAAIGTWETRGL